MKKLFPVLMSVSFLAALSAQAQQVQVDGVEVKAIAFEAQQTPQFDVSNVKSKKVPNPKEWLEIEVEFEAKSAARNAVIPELLFRYYVAIEAADGSVKALTGDVSHVNIVAGEPYFSAVYVSPMTLGAITGDFKRFQTNAIKAVAVEIFHNGVSKGGKGEGGNGRWWEQTQTQPGILGRDKTPFGMLWIDRYAPSKAAD